MGRLGAAVVGTGFIGPVHAEALRRIGVDVRGIVGSTIEKAEAAAEQLGISAYPDFDSALDDASVSVIHLATPNRLHHSQVLAAIKAGKHVMCEKPLAMNSKESRELVDVAEEHQCVAGVTHNIRSYPMCQEAANRVRSGEIGSLLHVNGSYVQDWLLYDSDFNWRVLCEEGGALRAVADIGTHWLDLIQHIVNDRVVGGFADLQVVHPTRQMPMGGAHTFSTESIAETESVSIKTEDAGTILLRFAGGGRGSLNVSQVTAGRKNCLRFEIAGSKSALAWNSEQPNQMWLGHRSKANEILLKDPSLLCASAAAGADYPGGHNEGFPDTFKQLFRQFYAYIQAGDLRARAPFPTFVDGHCEVRLCEAILASHKEERWVNIED